MDINGPQLYSVYPHGSYDKLPFLTMGTLSPLFEWTQSNLFFLHLFSKTIYYRVWSSCCHFSIWRSLQTKYGGQTTVIHSYWYFSTWYCICCYCSYICILTRGLLTPEGPSKGKYTQTLAWCSRTNLIGPCRSSMNEPQSFSCVKQACLIFLLPNLSAQCNICWQRKTKVKEQLLCGNELQSNAQL